MAIINAASCSFADVSTAVNASADGDTVILPVGTAAWATGLTIGKAITLQGSGVGQTILQDNIPAFASPQSMINWNLVAGKVSRMTAIEFNSGTRTAVVGGCIELNGSNADGRRIRIDHCKFLNLYGWCFEVWGALGVIDHNEIQSLPSGVSVAYVRHHNFNGGTAGDGSWAAPDGFGTEQFLFLEDNNITCNASQNAAAMDGFGGTRYVFRHNAVVSSSVQSHGTESAQRYRGARAMEIYNNSFVGNNQSGIVVYVRSGTGLIYNNTVSAYLQINSPFSLVNFRNDTAYTPFSAGNAEYSGADGKNPWDVNVAGGPFLTGTVASFAAGSPVGTPATLTVAGSPWTVNQWAGYSLNRTSGKAITSLTYSGGTITAVCPSHGFNSGDAISIVGANENNYNGVHGITVVNSNTFTCGVPFGSSPPATATGTIIAFEGNYFSEIISNTANTLTFHSSVDGAIYYLRFGAGDTFSLWKVSHALDQPGRSGGSLVTGDVPVRPVGWNNQVTSPWYQWNNTREGGVPLVFSAGYATIRAGEHYIDSTPAPGYAPFTYPHPLVSGAPPIDVVITSQPSNASVQVGQTANFSVTATGGSTLSYQWFFKGSPVGTNSSSYARTNCQLVDNSGAVSVNVTDTTGTVVSHSATLTVTSAPVDVVITSQPHSTSVQVGQTANFSVTATGNTTLHYQWFFDGGVVGTDSASYARVNCQPGDNLGVVVVSVSDVSGAVTSSAATLTVTSAPPPPLDVVISTPPQSISVQTGQSAVFSVVATGGTTLSYQWRFNGVSVGTNAATYTRVNCQLADSAGQITVVVSDATGSATSTPAAVLTVTNPPPPPPPPPVDIVIVTQPANVSVLVGQPATFSVVATGINISYAWSFNGAPVGTNAASYVRANCQLADSGGVVSVVISDATGSRVSNTAILTVSPVPLDIVILVQPQNQTVLVGGTAQFSVTAIGAAPLKYQWFFKGVLVSSGQSAIFRRSNCQLADNGGLVTVTITDSLNSVASKAAVLSVLPPTAAPAVAGAVSAQSVGGSMPVTSAASFTPHNVMVSPPLTPQYVLTVNVLTVNNP